MEPQEIFLTNQQLQFLKLFRSAATPEGFLNKFIGEFLQNKTKKSLKYLRVSLDISAGDVEEISDGSYGYILERILKGISEESLEESSC